MHGNYLKWRDDVLSIRKNYNHTIYASYIGYITQAIINNFAPLLFLTFQSEYSISLDKIALLVTLNFGTQLVVDFLATKFVDKIGYRVSIVAAHVFCAAGLIGLSVLPDITGNPFIGIVASVMIYAVGGGLTEVLISPIVEACPTDKKDGAMSLLHSFYCWGTVFVILVSTGFFVAAGIENWRVMARLWAIVPIFNCLYFALVPIQVLVEDGSGMTIGELFKSRIFWVLFLLMICSGASEQGMSQWASAFAESGLGVSKTIGDLAGPCAFSILMGCSRVFYGKFSEKINLHQFMMISCGLCIASYLLASLVSNPVINLIGCALCGLSVGIMWPGSFSTAAGALRRGGTAMFALLALSGDLGCAAGPALVGVASDLLGDNLKLGMIFAVVFPILLIVGIFMLKRCTKTTQQV